MTMGYLVALRNNQLDEITALVDAGSGAGKLRIYDGTQPATGGTVTILLAELVMSDPSFAAATGGVLTANAINDDTSADAAGTATWFRLVDSDNTFVADGTAGTVGTDLILNTDVFSVGLNVSVDSMTITGGNA